MKNGKRQPDSKLRDTENVPLKENISNYFSREVLPFIPDAWIDEKKTVIGYEIPFTRFFYKYSSPTSTDELAEEIRALNKNFAEELEKIFA